MVRKKVEAGTAACSTETDSANSLLRAIDGSAFARCEECKKDVAVALISMHSCSLDAKIKMSLKAQVVEAPAEVKRKPVERKISDSTAPKAKKAKKEKSNGPNKPKRPPTAFFLFMEDFRRTFKEANPDSKDVKRVAKEGGGKWKSMADEKKKQYMDKAAILKSDYMKALETSNADDEDDEGGSMKGFGDDEGEEVMDDEAEKD